MNHITLKNSGNKEKRFVHLILNWAEKNKRQFPWRRGRTPYKTLLAEILLQRTPANRVAKFFPKFVKRYPSAESLANASVNNLQKILRPMGLKKRAKWLTSLMKEICNKYKCDVPDQESDLVKLPGVGRYTARAILCFGYSKDVSIVDVNIARVLSRVFYGSDIKKKPSENQVLWEFATKIVPEGSGPRYNEALLDHGALICKKKPRCTLCPVEDICEYSKQG